MEEIILNAMVRNDKPNKVRSAGFIPGVLNSSGKTSTSVQFEITPLNKIIAKHGSNAKLWIALGNEKKFGFIKEVQTNPLSGQVIHIAVQLVSKDQSSKMQLPIIFHGHVELEKRLLQLQICKSEIEVIGKLEFMPETISVDVSKKESGENVTALDLNLSPELEILDADNEVYAVIKAMKEEVVEEPVEVEPAVPAE